MVAGAAGWVLAGCWLGAGRVVRVLAGCWLGGGWTETGLDQDCSGGGRPCLKAHRGEGQQ